MLKRITTGIVGIILATAGILASCSGELVALAPAGASTAQPTTNAPMNVPKWQTVPCAEEDSVNCYWNAGSMGNGVGHSFYTVRRHLVNAHGVTTGRAICVFYVKRADAKRWDACHVLPKGEDGSL